MPVSTPSDPQAAALLAHVLSQTQQNINFLAAQNYITPTEAAELITRLSQGPPTPSSTDALVSGVNNLSVGPARTPSFARNVPPPPSRNNVQKARAIWAYNEDGREPNDLSFSAGDVIEIIDETNGDWWTGKHRGKQGLFPSNHVEMLEAGRSMASPPPPVSSPMSMPTASSYYSPPSGPPQAYGMPEKGPAYQAPYQAPAYQAPAYQVPVYQPSYAPPAPPAPVQVPAPPAEQAPAQPPKKGRFGNLGNTMANSAAGGVGFGAGAAIGGGIVNAIF